MAQRIQVTLICDMHGDETPADETVTFGLDGSSYEADLCAEHAAQLRDRMATYVGIARRAGRAPATSSPRRQRHRGSGEAAAIRAWAREHGLKVPERGRIPADLAEKYAASKH